ncbi:SAM-dependent methyltransferase [Paractinoplanes toevensis]|uniref:S-adenosyl methyltransferase n=1 Tax=Paractinoplanes toevensis TaxID=571911 RepID=A0A919WCZ9_9ACTN|nr:SAM-dependent methyltransferase [Actinoplanes toevensis]GIM97954.1 hypothetical protein Ato02nite_097470 [Actinoplanes toevensis]
MSAPDWRFDASRPAPARRYDALLGGKDNLAPDRDSAEQIREQLPSVGKAAAELRWFLQRVVHFLADDCGVRQFIDIGCGMPFTPSVHEIVQTVSPDSVVVYVDPDEMVAVHSRAMLVSHPDGAIRFVEGGLDDIDTVLSDPQVRGLIDFTQPVAVLLLAVLHFVDDDQHAAHALNRIIQALPAGSYLAVSHVTFDPLPADQARRLSKLAEPGSGHGPFRARSHAQISALLDGLDLMPPGLVSAVDWYPHRHPQPQIKAEEAVAYGVVARIPATTGPGADGAPA